MSDTEVNNIFRFVNGIKINHYSYYDFNYSDVYI